jgi:Kef-type K+ transport system membrane component KefB
VHVIDRQDVDAEVFLVFCALKRHLEPVLEDNVRLTSAVPASMRHSAPWTARRASGRIGAPATGAGEEERLDFNLSTLLIVALIAVAAPLIAELPIGLRLPIVVLEIALGSAVGPHGLGLARAEGVLGFLGILGMTFLFFLAGLEIDFERIRGRPLALAGAGWLLSLALAAGTVALLNAMQFVRAPIMVTIALTTTAIGTLLPILRDAGELETPFGSFVLAAGAVGELGPILAISLVLTHDTSRWTQTGFMLGFVMIASTAVLVALRVHPPAAVALFARTMHASSQLPVRICIMLLVGLVTLADTFGLDMILGAFAAGLIVGLANRVGPDTGPTLHHKLDAIGFGFLIPIFFVTSGIGFDVASLVASPAAMLRVPVFLLLFLLIRGAPVLLYARALGRADLLPLALYSATALPLVVAITELGVSTGRMRKDNAAALVGAAMLSVLIFPLAAMALRARAGARERAGHGVR